MYSLMIFDDHQYIIDGIKKFVNFEELNIDCIDFATNGQEAIEKLLTNAPDIVITDIDMPFVTGIEIIQKATECNLKTKFILLTGYSEFDYAKQAISFNVVEYVTKPFMPQQITEALKKTVNMCEQERQQSKIRELLQQNKPILINNFIEELFFGEIISPQEFAEKCDFLQLPFNEKFFRCLCVLINDYDDFKEKTPEALASFTKCALNVEICEFFNCKKVFLIFTIILHIFCCISQLKMKKSIVMNYFMNP